MITVSGWSHGVALGAHHAFVDQVIGAFAELAAGGLYG